jgi:cell division protein FtsB
MYAYGILFKIQHAQKQVQFKIITKIFYEIKHLCVYSCRFLERGFVRY